MADNSATASQVPPEVNTNVPQTARIWNYWLGCKDKFPVGPQVGEQTPQAAPALVQNAPAPPARGPWRVRRAPASSSTSAPACPPPTTPPRSPRRWRPSPASSISTTTP